jgi:hypothetical protein
VGIPKLYSGSSGFQTGDGVASGVVNVARIASVFTATEHCRYKIVHSSE